MNSVNHSSYENRSSISSFKLIWKEVIGGTMKNARFKRKYQDIGQHGIWWEKLSVYSVCNAENCKGVSYLQCTARDVGLLWSI